MIIIYVCLLLVLIVILVFVRVAFILKSLNKISSGKLSFCKSMVVVGSGGHTAEMMSLMSGLSKKFVPRIYVLADTDNKSESKIEKMEKKKSAEKRYVLLRIRRSREVSQSWISTVYTTLIACFHAMSIVWRQQPDVIICNGPGTCIPICGAAFLLKVCFLTNTKIVFIESICRVNTLSLSGKILYQFADRVLVQWPELATKYPKSEYIGRLV